MGRTSSGMGGDAETKVPAGMLRIPASSAGSSWATVSPALTWPGVAPTRASAEGRWASSTGAWVMKRLVSSCRSPRATPTRPNHVSVRGTAIGAWTRDDPLPPPQAFCGDRDAGRRNRCENRRGSNLGHSRPTLTLQTYAHVMDVTDRRAGGCPGKEHLARSELKLSQADESATPPSPYESSLSQDP